jgi:hypothetical protein
MHIPGPTVIGWLSQCGSKAIEVARQSYNRECIGNNPSLFLQRVYSENSPQNCSATTLSPCTRRTGFAKIITPCPLSAHRRTVPKSPWAEICNVKGAILRWSAPALNTPFALTSRTTGRSRRRASSFGRSRRMPMVSAAMSMPRIATPSRPARPHTRPSATSKRSTTTVRTKSILPEDWPRHR